MNLKIKREGKPEWIPCSFGKLWDEYHYPVRKQSEYVLGGEWQVQFGCAESGMPVKLATRVVMWALSLEEQSRLSTDFGIISI